MAQAVREVACLSSRIKDFINFSFRKAFCLFFFLFSLVNLA